MFSYNGRYLYKSGCYGVDSYSCSKSKRGENIIAPATAGRFYVPKMQDEEVHNLMIWCFNEGFNELVNNVFIDGLNPFVVEIGGTITTYLGEVRDIRYSKSMEKGKFFRLTVDIAVPQPHNKVVN